MPAQHPIQCEVKRVIDAAHDESLMMSSVKPTRIFEMSIHISKSNGVRTSDEHSAHSQEHVEQSFGVLHVMSSMICAYGYDTTSLSLTVLEL